METSLTWKDLDELLSPLESLGDYCVRRGYTTRERIDECVAVQGERERAGEPRRLGEILVERGYVTRDQVMEALSAQQQEIRTCRSCRIQVNVPADSDLTTYCCPRCRGVLDAVSVPSSVSVVDDSALPADLDALPDEVKEARKNPARVLGRYILIEELGRGGVGIVYRAWDTYLEHEVALKLLRTDVEDVEDPAERQNALLKEARHTARLRHPRIVSILDVGRIAGQYYISMELVEGKTLETAFHLSRLEGKLSPYYQDPKGTIRLLEEVARAVHYAHTRPEPVIHCDLKPANILIDREGHPRILDFGLARRSRPGEAPTGQISGTPGYMAPEQAVGLDEKIGPRSDVYAFGCLLYEMLTGRPPFFGDPMTVLNHTLHQFPVSPSTVLRGMFMSGATAPSKDFTRNRFSRRLEQLCMSCLEKRPENRPGSLEEVADLLRRAATDTRRAPASQTSRRVIRRASASA